MNEAAKSKIRYAACGVVFLLVIVLWIGSYLCIKAARPDKPQEWGLIGDTFGAINALFSGLAFAGVVIALFLQRADLKLQQQQLKCSNDEFMEQTRIMQEQLRLTREAYELEIKHLKNESEPLFEWTKSTSNPAIKACHYVNRGGRFKITQIYLKAPVKITLTPPGRVLLNHGAEGRIQIQNQREGENLPPLPIRFGLECTSQNGDVWRIDFIIEQASDNPIEVRRAAY
jgi:hypothetical protein